MSRLYVAYGSNLHKRSMRIRCPTARPLGKFMLTNAKLVFRGVADVEYAVDRSVPCGLWEIGTYDEAALDRYEGVSSGFYSKNESIILKHKGRKRNALIYLMNSEGVYPPSEDYVETLRAGYKDFGLDESFLETAIKESFNNKEPDEQTEKRRERQKQDCRHRRLVEMPEAVARARLEARRAILNQEEA